MIQLVLWSVIDSKVICKPFMETAFKKMQKLKL